MPMALASRRTLLRRPYIVIWLVLLVVICSHTLIQQPFELSLDNLHLGWADPPLPRHTLTPDGLLVVNPRGPHPIFQLINDAEAAWKEKHARASTTLQEAVAEYRRRYQRPPPLGFDKWWDYAVKHHIRLPDEYDEIFEDIEPFWGIDPRDLARTQQQLEQQNGVVTVRKTDVNPRLEIVRSNLPSDDLHSLKKRITDILALVNEVEQDLPPMRIAFSPSDEPDMFSSWHIKSMALKAAADGTTLTNADLPPVTEVGWLQACPPDSPAWLYPPTLPPTPTPFPPSSPKTFIASHRDTMDPCWHPSLLTTHAQFLRYAAGPRPQSTLVPRFSLCRTALHHDIRPPVPYEWDYDAEPEPEDEEDEEGAYEGDVPWEHKLDQRLDWRGRTTGMYASQDTWWENAHRQRLVTLTNLLEGNVSVLGVPQSGIEYMPAEIPVGEPESLPLVQINPLWMDTGFTDEPIGCDQPICDEMARLWPFLEMQDRHEEGQYKFIIDLDGNGWSGRFKRLITSNALIFKATIYPEWYTSRIMPWVHYVPIQVSYADLYDTVAFFREHDALAKRIAWAGRAWSRQYYTRADITAYLYRLLLEYARVTSLDRESMDYIG